MTKRVITVGHSPDPDDAFMFYALAHDKIPTGDVVRYEAKMLGEAKAKIPEVFESIRTKREIVSETEEKLKAFLETFTKNFA